MTSSSPSKRRSLLFHNLSQRVLNNIYDSVIPQKELDTEPFNYSLSLSLPAVGDLSRFLDLSNGSSSKSVSS